MLPLCAERVSFEGRWLAGEEQLRPALARLGERAQLRSLQLVDLHILSVEAMVARFGPPPERLRDAIRRGDSIVLARFNQQGAIAVMAKAGRFWRIKALTD